MLNPASYYFAKVLYDGLPRRAEIIKGHGHDMYRYYMWDIGFVKAKTLSLLTKYVYIVGFAVNKASWGLLAHIRILFLIGYIELSSVRLTFLRSTFNSCQPLFFSNNRK